MLLQDAIQRNSRGNGFKKCPPKKTIGVRHCVWPIEMRTVNCSGNNREELNTVATS